MAQINLQELEQELQGFRGKLERWAQGAVSSAELARDSHFSKIKKLQATLRDLEQTQERLSREADEVEQRLAAEEAEVGNLQAELERISEEQAALPAAVAELSAALDAERAEFDRREAELSNQEAAKERKLNALRTALAVYRERLGMAFEHAEGDGEQLRVVFTEVDPRDHARPFRFAVEVVADDTYKVQSCDPEIAALPALLRELNATNKFHEFVRSVRREFQGVVAAEVAAAAAGAGAAQAQPVAAC